MQKVKKKISKMKIILIDTKHKIITIIPAVELPLFGRTIIDQLKVPCLSLG